MDTKPLGVSPRPKRNQVIEDCEPGHSELHQFSWWPSEKAGQVRADTWEPGGQ